MSSKTASPVLLSKSANTTVSFSVREVALIDTMAGKTRLWLNEHPVASFALWFAGLWVVLGLVQIVYRLITGDWCP